jgi:hypothetical protein
MSLCNFWFASGMELNSKGRIFIWEKGINNAVKLLLLTVRIYLAKLYRKLNWAYEAHATIRLEFFVAHSSFQESCQTLIHENL